jgi:hypothetical protein
MPNRSTTFSQSCGLDEIVSPAEWFCLNPQFDKQIFCGSNFWNLTAEAVEWWKMYYKRMQNKKLVYMTLSFYQSLVTNTVRPTNSYVMINVIMLVY